MSLTPVPLLVALAPGQVWVRDGRKRIVLTVVLPIHQGTATIKGWVEWRATPGATRATCTPYDKFRLWQRQARLSAT